MLTQNMNNTLYSNCTFYSRDSSFLFIFCICHPQTVFGDGSVKGGFLRGLGLASVRVPFWLQDSKVIHCRQ